MVLRQLHMYVLMISVLVSKHLLECSFWSSNFTQSATYDLLLTRYFQQPLPKKINCRPPGPVGPGGRIFITEALYHQFLGFQNFLLKIKVRKYLANQTKCTHVTFQTLCFSKTFSISLILPDLFTLALSILLYFAGRSRRDTIWQLLGNIAQKSLLSRGGASSYFSPPLVYSCQLYCSSRSIGTSCRVKKFADYQ